MNRSTRSIRKFVLCTAFALAAIAPAWAQEKAGISPDAGPRAESRAARQAREERFLAARDRMAKEQYEAKAAALALRTDEAAAASRENAALLYHHALLAYREPDPCTAQVLNAVARGGEPDTRVKVYLGRSLRTIELAQIASQMPQCHWGPMKAGEYHLDLNLGIPLRRLSRLLDADARTLAADGHHRAALARCLTLRRLAHHAGVETYNLYSISQSIHTLALLAAVQILSTGPLDARTLNWFKGQLAAVPGTPFEPAQTLNKWRDTELQFWRTRLQGRPFTRDLVLGKVPDANDRRDLSILTDDQLLVIALQAEQRVPGIYGISAPPQLLERAQQACNQYLQSALQIMKADLSYREKHARLQAMVDALDDRALAGDPIAILSEAPKVVELYHRLLVRNAVYDNLATTALEILLVKARTGQLPRVLPSGLPKDLYTDRGFDYERTAKGFLLRFDPNNLSRIPVRQFEFKTPDSGS
ncbi:MAG: hypothetical protein M1376_04555 [Planctomycetes bacterium]|nr:hypothetical protein [Planctomycetota bacterium]